MTPNLMTGSVSLELHIQRQDEDAIDIIRDSLKGDADNDLENLFSPKTGCFQCRLIIVRYMAAIANQRSCEVGKSLVSLI